MQVCIYIHTYSYVDFVHMYMCRYMHNAYTRAHTYTYAHVYTRTCVCVYKYKYKYKYMNE